MYPHRIRLRGPWEYQPLPAPAAPQGAGGRAVMPCRWDGIMPAEFRGQVRFVRPFGYPGRVDDFERVWLTITGTGPPADALLNGARLEAAQPGPLEYDITPLLRQRNRLELTLAVPPNPGEVWAEVALEVRRTAYLRAALACGPDGPEIEVQGVVLGEAPGRLELYALADGRHVHYQTIEARPEGQPFRFALTGEPSCQVVRLELVQVATVWYALELPVGA